MTAALALYRCSKCHWYFAFAYEMWYGPMWVDPIGIYEGGIWTRDEMPERYADCMRWFVLVKVM